MTLVTLVLMGCQSIVGEGWAAARTDEQTRCGESDGARRARLVGPFRSCALDEEALPTIA
ncbi:hypothetical protein [Streptomyces sp. NPDC086023]|uniref:hypothetical protein n=1 Tax=Streptomyces sp. NPDC086023 TaxID=3365746 RepID=UPI0037D0970B